MRRDGSIECWGSNDDPSGNVVGQASPPGGEFSSVSAGTFHTCGVRTNGTVECWGANELDGTEIGQATPPGGEFASVSAGGLHTCGVRTNGSVECWGANRDLRGTVFGQATPPSGEFASVSAGGSHTCGVRSDGSVECWGDDRFGQTTRLELPEPSVPPATPLPTAHAVPTAAATPTASGMSRRSFEMSTPPEYIQITLADRGTVWGVPDRFTTDSSLGDVVYMLLGSLKGCDFANEELDRASIVYIKWDRLGHLPNYESTEICGKSSSTWETGWDGIRITHLRHFDESSPTSVREFVYDESRGEYIETSSGSNDASTVATPAPAVGEQNGKDGRTSTGDPGGLSDLASFIRLMQLIPLPAADQGIVFLTDYIQARGAHNIVAPAMDAGVEELEEYLRELHMTGLHEGPWIKWRGPPETKAQLEQVKHLGFVIGGMERSIMVEITPVLLEAVVGRFDPEATRRALAACTVCPDPVVNEHQGLEFYSWGEDLELDLNMRLHPPAFDELGRGGRIAVTNLTQLHLTENALTGEIPPELGSPSNLTLLYLGQNDLSGWVPSSLRDHLGSYVTTAGRGFCLSHAP